MPGPERGRRRSGGPPRAGGGRAIAFAVTLVVLAAAVVAPRAARASPLALHPTVRGAGITAAEWRAKDGAWQATAWDDLSRAPRSPGRYELRFRTATGASIDAVEVPVCAGRKGVRVDGLAVADRPGPIVAPVAAGAHEVVIDVDVSKYERRIACGEQPVAGHAESSADGLSVLSFGSPYASKGGGQAVVYVPPGHDVHRPSPLLVGAHPWNGSIWTYAAYAELLREARARDVVLLMPSGLGNSLYTSDAEDEVMRAIDAVAGAVAIDPRAVSIWGASMGGAGATTIGLHHPDRFASVTSFFGDSQYDLSTYVRAILPDEGAAHLVNAADVVENARHLPVWLIHGEDDRVSSIHQSEVLADALRRSGFTVRFDRVPGIGHAGALVARFVAGVVDVAAAARVPDAVTRVTYRSVREGYDGAYGVRIVRGRPTGDAFVDVERTDDAVHVRRAEGVSAVVLARGALGTPAERPPPIVVDGGGAQATWAPAR